MNWGKLQQEHRQWLARMYPGQPPELPAAGLIEEAAELLHAVIALERTKRWGEERRRPVNELRNKLIDAVGDCVIYAVSLCNTSDTEFATVMVLASENHGRLLGSALTEAGRLVYDATQVLNDIARWQQALVRFLRQLRAVSAMLDVSVESATQAAWLEVSQRTR